MRLLTSLLSSLLLFLSAANAQFAFFDQMFQQQGQRHEPQNVASDSSWYQQNYDNGIVVQLLCTILVLIRDLARCSNYLCPDTLGTTDADLLFFGRHCMTDLNTACVSFPHHCPCPHPAVEEKFELSDGKSICISKGGFRAGEAARKVELARKGLL